MCHGTLRLELVPDRIGKPPPAPSRSSDEPLSRWLRRTLEGREKRVMKASTYAGAALVAVLLAGPAMAQQTGESTGQTSGPAAGGNVTPSTATQKHKSTHTGASHHTHMSSGHQGTAGGSAMGAGAPGVEAKPGSEGGPAPKTPTQ